MQCKTSQSIKHSASDIFTKNIEFMQLTERRVSLTHETLSGFMPCYAIASASAFPNFRIKKYEIQLKKMSTYQDMLFCFLLSLPTTPLILSITYITRNSNKLEHSPFTIPYKLQQLATQIAVKKWVEQKSRILKQKVCWHFSWM